MNDATLNGIANIVVLVGGLPALLFVLIYGIGSPWYKSSLGVVMFLLGLSFVLTFAQVITHRLLGNYPGYGLVGLGAYALVVIVLFGLVIIVIRERRAPRGSMTIPLKKNRVDHE